MSSIQVNQAAEQIYDLIDADANVIFGAVVDPKMPNGEVRKRPARIEGLLCSPIAGGVAVRRPRERHEQHGMFAADPAVQCWATRCWTVAMSGNLCRTQVAVTLIATGLGMGDGTGSGGAALPIFGTVATPSATPQEAPPPLPSRESGGIEIPAFLRKRRDRGL